MPSVLTITAFLSREEGGGGGLLERKGLLKISTSRWGYQRGGLIRDFTVYVVSVNFEIITYHTARSGQVRLLIQPIVQLDKYNPGRCLPEPLLTNP